MFKINTITFFISFFFTKFNDLVKKTRTIRNNNSEYTNVLETFIIDIINKLVKKIL